MRGYYKPSMSMAVAGTRVAKRLNRKARPLRGKDNASQGGNNAVIPAATMGLDLRRELLEPLASSVAVVLLAMLLAELLR
jgi:hypothetical protein